MLSFETAKWRFGSMKGKEFPLVFWRGTGRIVDVGETKIAVQVRGKRADLTWDRLQNAWQRVRTNHTVTVDELGGGHDAVAVVALLASLRDEDVEVVPEDGMLRLRAPQDQPEHQFVAMTQPATWTAWRRKIDGE